MSAKQDRVPARTPADLERKYNFGESFADAMGIATDAQKTAEAAQDSANSVAQKMNPEDIFNILTDNGTLQGMFRGDDGEIYINASYLKTGKVVSADGQSFFDLETGTIRSKSGDNMPYVEIKGGDIFFYNASGAVVARMFNPLFGLQIYFFNPDTGALVGSIGGQPGNMTIGCYDQDTGDFRSHAVHWKTVGDYKTLVAF